jgi:AcrR family transcriptional regulator
MPARVLPRSWSGQNVFMSKPVQVRAEQRRVLAGSGDPRAERTRHLLVDALDELARDNALEGLTVARLTRVAHVTRAAFYSHFPDLAAFIRSVVERDLADVTASFHNNNVKVGMTLAEATRISLEETLDRVIQRPALYTWAMGETSILPARTVTDIFAAAVARSVEQTQVIPAGLRPGIVVDFIAGGVATAIAGYLHRDRIDSRDEVVAAMTASLPSWFTA